MPLIPYPTDYRRPPVREVRIGKLCIGGNHPPLIQSMLTQAASNPEAAFAEAKALFAAGCPLIRLTIPTEKELAAAVSLRERLQSEGLLTAQVADIHFQPKLALAAAQVFEKIRINPGNLVDQPKNKGQALPQDLAEGCQRLAGALAPLVQVLKRHHCALRIGVNHGSLAQRMIEAHGDSPLGMVESALEAAGICEALGFDQIVISLKSSNPLVTNLAYRLLASRQPALGYPLHLGVTEAGMGEMARIKSLAGIAPLLRDGLGDTLRVSLAEDSVYEIPYAQALVQGLEEARQMGYPRPDWQREITQLRVNNQEHPIQGLATGGLHPVRVFSAVSLDGLEDQVLTEQTQFTQIPDLGALPPLPLSCTPAYLLTAVPDLHQVRNLYRQRGPLNAPLGLLLGPSPMPVRLESDFCALLAEGLLDFVVIPAGLPALAQTRWLQFLQALRVKSFEADYIACPSCGRTLFDLQGTTLKIRAQTRHLKGVKIGIMGCIVNGPGEMADAHFGYVGSGPGKIDLYYGQTCVQRGLPEENAVAALLALIKEKGAWQEPNLS